MTNVVLGGVSFHSWILKKGQASLFWWNVNSLQLVSYTSGQLYSVSEHSISSPIAAVVTGNNANCSLIVAPSPVPLGTAYYRQVANLVVVMWLCQLWVNSWCHLATIKQQSAFLGVITIAAAIRQFLLLSPAIGAWKSHCYQFSKYFI